MLPDPLLLLLLLLLLGMKQFILVAAPVTNYIKSPRCVVGLATGRDGDFDSGTTLLDGYEFHFVKKR